MNKDNIKITEILDLNETEYSFLFKGLTYPFEVLPLIKQKFDECVRSLNTYEYNRIKDGVYVHKSVTVLKSVYLGRNIIIGKDVDFLSTAHLMPAVQGIVGVPTSEIVVSHYPPQHAVLTAAACGAALCVRVHCVEPGRVICVR